MKSFQEYINEVYLVSEGGWATTKTQNTTITPDIIEKSVKFIESISKEFNQHLKGLNLPPLEFMKPIGSGTWWEDDLQTQPDKTYGDIDFLVAYPVLKLTEGGEKADESATVRLYNEELLNWIDKIKNPAIDVEESRKISNINSLKLLFVTKLKSGEQGYIQIDLVVTHSQYKDWAVFRLTPMRNVKGFVLGNLYSSFGEVLDLSVQLKGVRAKFKNEVIVPYSSRGKDVDEKLISQSASSFLQDTAQFFWDNSNTEKSFDNTYFSKWKGIDSNSPKIEDLCDGIIAFSKTIEQLGEFGSSINKYKSSAEFLKAVFIQYQKKMMIAYNDSKFNKAESPAAKMAIEKIRNLIEIHINIVENKLK